MPQFAHIAGSAVGQSHSEHFVCKPSNKFWFELVMISTAVGLITLVGPIPVDPLDCEITIWDGSFKLVIAEQVPGRIGFWSIHSG